MPFLTVVTRCCKRPCMLTSNIESVLSQSDRDVEQIFIVDYEQAGVRRANISLAQNKDRVDGDYVYILDDDTRLFDKGFVARLKRAAKGTPDIIMVKSSRPQFAPHVLPKPFVWNCPDRLALTSTNCLCYVVKRRVWLEHIEAFGESAAGDWHFLKAVRDSGASFAWLDEVVAETQQLGRGRLFEECGKDWFRKVAQKWGLQELEPGDWRLSLYAHPKPHTFWGTEPGEIIQQGDLSASIQSQVSSREHKQPLRTPRHKPVSKSKYVRPKVTIVTRVPEPVLPVPAHSLLSRRRKRE